MTPEQELVEWTKMMATVVIEFVGIVIIGMGLVFDDTGLCIVGILLALGSHSWQISILSRFAKDRHR